jgi:hypothetical protein
VSIVPTSPKSGRLWSPLWDAAEQVAGADGAPSLAPLGTAPRSAPASRSAARERAAKLLPWRTDTRSTPSARRRVCLLRLVIRFGALGPRPEPGTSAPTLVGSTHG